MAHELEIRKGKVSMMYVGEVPWHGLGTKLKDPATSAEAIQAANLNWRVIKKPIYAYGPENLHSHHIKDRFAIVREDLWGQEDCPVYGLVGKNYTPLQNVEAFSFFDSIVGKKAAIYNTAGAVLDGQRIWILAKLPGEIKVVGDDITHKYLLLSNSHDGNSSVQIKFTPIRVVCQNTLTMALSRGPTVRVSHFKDLQKRLRQAEKILGIVSNKYDRIEKSYQEMAKVPMTGNRLTEYLQEVFPDPADPDNEKALKKVQNNRVWSRDLFENGEGNKQPRVSGTLWAAYNGVTEFIDHTKTPRQMEDRRLNSIWFGEGYLVKARAYEIANAKLATWLN